MFGKVTLVALVGALSVSANQVSSLLTRSEHAPMFSRQLTAAQIPSACQSQCTSALSIYQACTTGDQTTCLSVCQPANYQGFVGCLQCVLSNTPGVTSAETTALNSVLGQLGSACGQAGSPVSSATLVASGASGSVSRSASGSAVSGTSSVIASTTRPISAGQGPSSSGAASSLTGALSSVSSVIAASSSRAAGDALAPIPQGLHSIALGLVGVVAGAAFIL